MGGPTPTPPPTASITSVAVSCASATVNVGQTSQCSATVQGTGNFSSSVTWAVSGVQGGNSTVGIVSSTGLYTAPNLVPNPGAVTVSAISSTDTTKSATATLNIKLSISVSPQDAKIQLFHPQQFMSTISGVTNTNVTWAINGVAGGNPNIGQITATGLYTPPVSLPSPANITVTATSQADTTQSASAIASLSSDTTALSVTKVSPAGNAAGVSVQTPISITFNEAVDPSTVSTGSISLSEGGTNVPAQYSYDATANTVTLTPLVLLDPQAVCTITVGTQIHDLGGNPLATTYTSSFTIEAPLSLTGTVTPPSGVDPASLTVLSFQGQHSATDSNGNFSANTSPVGITLISAMFSAEASGLMAITISNTSTNPTSSARTGISATATPGSMEINPFLPTATTKPLVQIRTHQITASAAKASSTNGLVLDFQTTAEAVLFLSPALFRNDPQGATSIMTAIAADLNTQALASALSQAWNESHPLQDPNVSTAYTTALNSILTTLIQQSGNATPSAANSTSGSEKAVSSLADASSAQADTVTTLPVYTPLAVCCISVNPFTISGSNFTSAASVIGPTLFNPLDNAAGWVMRIVPLASSFNPGSLQPVNGEANNPDSPGPVNGENNPDAQRATWIPSNSIFKIWGLVKNLNSFSSSVIESIYQAPPGTDPQITLQQIQPAFYLVRYFSGGTADGQNELPLVESSSGSGEIYKGQGLWRAAVLSNYGISILNIAFLGQSNNASGCLIQGLIDNGTIATLTEMNLDPGNIGNIFGYAQVQSILVSGLVGVATSPPTALGVASCFVDQLEQEQSGMLTDAIARMDATNVAKALGEAPVLLFTNGAPPLGAAVEMMEDLWLKDRPVDTAYIQVLPPPPTPAASVVISPSTLSLAVGQNGMLAATAYDSSQNAIPNTPFTWTSSNQGVVQISGSGGSANVTAVSMGTATVTATTPNGAQGTVILTVSAAQAQNLPAPTLFGPANGATGVLATPTFSWSAVPGSVGYRLLVATSAAALPNSPSVGSCGGCIVNAAISGTSYTPSSALNGSTVYYWEVHALTPVSNPGFGAWSSISSFTSGGSMPPPANSNEWTWISGSNSIDAIGVYGTLGVASPLNIPAARYGAVSWTDSSGNLWLFGGGGDGGYDASIVAYDLNDLWKFNPTAKTWAWVSGANTTGATGNYGTQGVPAAANVPGARRDAVSWIDSSGNLWLFGGGVYSNATDDSFNDLWEFNPTTREWTWVSGSDTVNAVGVYGTQGVASATNVPGARGGAVSWIDSSGNLWLFGGENLATGFSFNDLWEFNPTTREWTWVSGSDTVNAVGVYGTLGVPSPSNVPGGRSSAASWIDSSGNLWLFGGYGYESNGTEGDFNDLWEFNTTNKEWTWVSGSNTFLAQGIYGTQGVPSSTNIPGGRDSAVSWIDSSGNLWLFGGNGQYSPIGDYVTELNDLWEFNPVAKTWTWVSGADTVSASSVYGTLGMPAPTNVPGARRGASGWVDVSGNLWLFGGEITAIGNAEFNDLWRYQP